MTALHQILEINAELPPLQCVHALRLCPHIMLHSIGNRTHKPLCNAPFDLLVELAGGDPFRLLETRIACKENIGKIVIARLRNGCEIHTTLK